LFGRFVLDETNVVNANQRTITMEEVRWMEAKVESELEMRNIQPDRSTTALIEECQQGMSSSSCELCRWCFTLNETTCKGEAKIAVIPASRHLYRLE
jgi:hypothetical protein